MPNRRCIYCENLLGGATSRKANEHFVSAWLLREMGVYDEKIRFTAYDEFGAETQHRTLTAGNLLAGRVCAECNNGWLGDLDSAVKDIIVPFVQNATTPARLGLDDRLTLGRWVCKAAFGLDVFHHGRRRVPDNHPHELFANREQLPERVVVFAVSSPFTIPMDLVEYNSWQVIFTKPPDQSSVARDISGSYKIGFQFGSLILIVAFWPNPDFAYGHVRNMHLALGCKDVRHFESIRERTPTYSVSRDYLNDALNAIDVTANDYVGGITSGPANIVRVPDLDSP